MGQSNQAISVDKYSLAVSLRYVSGDTAAKIKVFTTCILFGVVIVAILCGISEPSRGIPSGQPDVTRRWRVHRESIPASVR